MNAQFLKYWIVRGLVLSCALITLGSAFLCGFGLYRGGADEVLQQQLLYRHFGITWITALVMIGPSIMLFEDQPMNRPIDNKNNRGDEGP